MSHIIGRPDDHFLDVMLGPGADPEQTFIGGSEQGSEEAVPPMEGTSQPTDSLEDVAEAGEPGQLPE